MSSLNVPCVLIDKHNLQRWWPKIIETLHATDFLAIDLEFSGLGTRDLNSFHIDDRYKALVEVTSTRSILSMGLACFQVNPKKGFFKHDTNGISPHDAVRLNQIFDCLDSTNTEELIQINKDHNYHITARVFDFLCLSNEYVIESNSMKFLVEQGFDFNNLARKGIPYSRGNDQPFEEQYSLRNLFAHIVAIKPIIVIHNGLLDLAFLYQNFYAELPSKSEVFLSDLSEMFSNGIFDTKYIANFDLPNSYLEYLFNSSQRKNYFRRLKDQPCIEMKFTQFAEQLEEDVRYFDLSAVIFQTVDSTKSSVCTHYAKYGWCDKLDKCSNSHNIDLILDEELQCNKSKKNKELVNHLKSLASNGSDSSESTLKTTMNRKIGSHHSGSDAFMTGYYLLFYLLTNFSRNSYDEFKRYYENLKKFKNKVFLSGKAHPLNVLTSSYSHPSTNHRQKGKKIQNIVDNFVQLKKHDLLW